MDFIPAGSCTVEIFTFRGLTVGVDDMYKKLRVVALPGGIKTIDCFRFRSSQARLSWKEV